MGPTAQPRAFFFNGPVGTAYSIFRTQNIPTEVNYRKLFDSAAFFYQPEDAASVTIQGLINLQTDALVRTRSVGTQGTTAFSWAVQPQQLPNIVPMGYDGTTFTPVAENTADSATLAGWGIKISNLISSGTGYNRRNFMVWLDPEFFMSGNGEYFNWTMTANGITPNITLPLSGLTDVIADGGIDDNSTPYVIEQQTIEGVSKWVLVQKTLPTSLGGLIWNDNVETDFTLLQQGYDSIVKQYTICNLQYPYVGLIKGIQDRIEIEAHCNMVSYIVDGSQTSYCKLALYDGTNRIYLVTQQAYGDEGTLQGVKLSAQVNMISYNPKTHPAPSARSFGVSEVETSPTGRYVNNQLIQSFNFYGNIIVEVHMFSICYGYQAAPVNCDKLSVEIKNNLVVTC